MTHTWQPIETAPKDGTEILLFENIGGDFLCYWVGHWNNTDSGSCYWVDIFDDREAGHPTHWMPLPKPPVQP